MLTPMPRPLPPHLHRERTRHGALVWYVRVGKGPRTRLRDAYGTEEFWRAYRTAVSGDPRERPRQRPQSGTLAWLIARYRETTAWSDLAPATRAQRECTFRALIKSSGAKPAADISTADISATVDSKKDKPSAARHFMQAARGKMNSIRVEFADGFTMITSGNAIRKAKEIANV